MLCLWSITYHPQPTLAQEFDEVLCPSNTWPVGYENSTVILGKRDAEIAWPDCVYSITGHWQVQPGISRQHQTCYLDVRAESPCDRPFAMYDCDGTVEAPLVCLCPMLGV